MTGSTLFWYIIGALLSWIAFFVIYALFHSLSEDVRYLSDRLDSLEQSVRTLVNRNYRHDR